MAQLKQNSRLDSSEQADVCWSTVTLTTDFTWIFCSECAGQSHRYRCFLFSWITVYLRQQLYFLFSCKPSLNCFFRLEQSLQMQLMMDSGLRDLFLLWVTPSLEKTATFSEAIISCENTQGFFFLPSRPEWWQLQPAISVKQQMPQSKAMPVRRNSSHLPNKLQLLQHSCSWLAKWRLTMTLKPWGGCRYLCLWITDNSHGRAVGTLLSTPGFCFCSTKHSLSASLDCGQAAFVSRSPETAAVDRAFLKWTITVRQK